MFNAYLYIYISMLYMYIKIYIYISIHRLITAPNLQESEKCPKTEGHSAGGPEPKSHTRGVGHTPLRHQSLTLRP